MSRYILIVVEFGTSMHMHTTVVLSIDFSLVKQVCRSSVLSGRNVRWPRHMLPGESR